MPLTYSRTFRVRYYECDGYGHLNNANYLRYMQETAFDASAAAGYDLKTYDEIGGFWLIRETDIEYRQPLRYDDRVTITTWVEDFRRARSRRVYEFAREDGTLAARAVTDWVYLDAATRRPARIPEEMKRAFFPDGLPAEPVPRERFPEAPPPPPGVFTMRRHVEWRDIDPQWHVNNANYLAFCEEAGIRLAETVGWSFERMRAEGFGLIARRTRIEYLTPAVLTDELDVATWVSNMRAASGIRHYRLTRVSDGELVARALTHVVAVDVETGRPVRVPPSFIADFAPNIVSG